MAFRGWRAALALGVPASALALTLAIPLPLWRTGDQGLAAMSYGAQPWPEGSLRRLWVDADAACGTGRRTDPDDCLAIVLLARAGAPLVGISTVFGNAPRERVDDVTRQLLAELAAEGWTPPPLHPGADRALPPHGQVTAPNRARDALIRALEAGPLTLLALGPLTNVAAALDARPELATRVTRLVAVMGRRPGHLFHPAEGAAARSFFGHGPVFRDFNVAQDVQAARRVLAHGLSITLVPYDASRSIEMTPVEVARWAESGRAGRWLAPRLRGWLDYWVEDIGRGGFAPFDLLAAAYVLAPDAFGCAPVRLRLGNDPQLLPPMRWRASLLASPVEQWQPDTDAPAAALYCARPGRPIMDIIERGMNHRAAATGRGKPLLPTGSLTDGRSGTRCGPLVPLASTARRGSRGFGEVDGSPLVPSSAFTRSPCVPPVPAAIALALLRTTRPLCHASS
jgi:inosine-uridine nucleoside N-ribohydrolase